jgi:hypothetical protein
VNTQRTYTANKEQLAITIRYVDKEKNIKENFLSFRDVSADTSGESLSKELLTFIDEAGFCAFPPTWSYTTVSV